MSSGVVANLLSTDQLTYALGLAAAATYLLGNYLIPFPLVHPISLGRQSDVERVRKPGESAVYRNFGTQMTGRLPARPANGVNTTSDFLKSDFTESRSLWNTKLTNADLKKRVDAFASGLVNVPGVQPKESNVLLLLNDGLEFLISDLALASQSIPSVTVSSLTLLSAVLDSHPPNAIILHIHLLGYVLEQIAENSEYSHHTLIVVGEGDLPSVVNKLPVKILWFADVERKGAKITQTEANAPEPNDIFTLSCYPGPNNELRATEITHLNMTAGVAATRALFPLNGAITPSDSILSSYALSSPYGRAVAYTALYEGASFSTTKSSAIFKLREDQVDNTYLHNIRGLNSEPTLLFLNPPELEGLTSSVLSSIKKTVLYPLAWRHKLFQLQNGVLRKDTFWDEQVFNASRKQALGNMANTLRAVIIGNGAVEAKALTPARLALSVPVVNVHTNPLVAGPIFFSHPLDFQDFGDSPAGVDPKLSSSAHVGPPAINVEAKLLGVDDEAIENGSFPIGEIAVRGPSVGTPHDDDVKVGDNWILLGEQGLVQTNGTFKVKTII